MAKVSLEKDKIKFLLVEGVHQSAIDNLRSAGYTNIEFHKGTLDSEALKESIRDAHFIGIRSRTNLTEEIFAVAEKLVAVGCFCIGTNQVDLHSAAVRGIPVFNAPFSNTRSVAELVIGELLLMLRGVPAANAKAHRGVWHKLAVGSFEARGKKLGIIGYGHIGMQLGVLAESLGMHVFFYDIENKLPLGNATQVQHLSDLLNMSDVVSLHVPETQSTQNMMGAEELALTLAIVASLETLLSQEALKKMQLQNPPPSPDKEMRAQGIGNALCGFLGGLPITAVIVRSSVNVSAGAQSKLSILLHGMLLLICGLWFSGILNAIPLASLAAVLLYTGCKLAPPGLFVSQMRQGAQQSVPFIATVGGILIFGMLAGIGIGLATQVLFSIYKSQRNAMHLTRYDDHYVLSFQQNLTFMHNLRLKGLLAQIPENSVVIVDHDSAEYIDPDVKALLKDFGEGAKKRGIQLNQWPVKLP
ncbi:hypothetical protein EWM60_06535 [Candidatus Erwinia dacicola]|nr:hypothetical protein [Candidatus Erwinia dacicola]